MKYIVEVNDLCDFYTGKKFGSIGVELDTGKFRYYTNYDNNGIYHINKLFEFDIDNPNSEVLKNHLKYCDCKRERYSKDLPDEMELFAYDYIKKHLFFNIYNGYPIDKLLFNNENLSIQYLYYNEEFVGQYIPIENVIKVTVTKENWHNSDNVMMIFDTLNHESGHMKVTGVKFNPKTNELYIQIGFYRQVAKVNPIVLENGDTFLQIINIKKIYENGIDQMLEEIINDFECGLIDDTYIGAYPNFGKQLNELCDGKLLLARYTNGIEQYYESLEDIISSRSLADELLQSIVELDNCRDKNYKKNKTYTLKIIKKYYDEKYK